MAHQAQRNFAAALVKRRPDLFERRQVVEFGAQDVNGTVRDLFKDCWYIGVDRFKGRGVDVQSLCHEFMPSRANAFDVVLSFEMLEHDPYWKQSLRSMYRLLRDGGALLLSFATGARPTHGTPGTDGFDHCAIAGSNYCENLLPTDIASVLPPYYFSTCELTLEQGHQEVYLFGIKEATPDLTALADKYGTDKGSGLHYFTKLYQTAFHPYRKTWKAVLEIGVKEGASLRMWADYFPEAEVVGIDVDGPKLATERIRTIRGNSGDVEFLRTVVGEYDLIVDDGGHRPADQKIALGKLFRHNLALGGCYVIEDVHTSEDPERFGPGDMLGLVKDWAAGRFPLDHGLPQGEADYLRDHMLECKYYKHGPISDLAMIWKKPS